MFYVSLDKNHKWFKVNERHLQASHVVLRGLGTWEHVALINRHGAINSQVIWSVAPRPHAPLEPSRGSAC